MLPLLNFCIKYLSDYWFLQQCIELMHYTIALTTTQPNMLLSKACIFSFIFFAISIALHSVLYRALCNVQCSALHNALHNALHDALHYAFLFQDKVFRYIDHHNIRYIWDHEAGDYKRLYGLDIGVRCMSLHDDYTGVDDNKRESL